MDYDKRFLSKVDTSQGPTACWPWTGRVNGGGYGQLIRHGKLHSAHRVALERAEGPIPPGLYVLHKCDNPRCCNPAHLYTGTPQDNVDDMVDRERIHRKHTYATVQAVIAYFAEGTHSLKATAAHFKIPYGTVWAWIRRPGDSRMSATNGRRHP